MSEKKNYSVIKQQDGTYKIPSVEVFEMGTHRGTTYDQTWFDEWSKNFNTDKHKGFLPGVIIGHNEQFQTSEKAVIAFADNPHIIGNHFAMDYIIETDGGLDILKSGAFPHRSVEVDPKDHRIMNVAHLGGTTPFHKMPPLRIQNFKLMDTIEGTELINFDSAEMSLTEIVEDNAKRQALNELDWALWDKLWLIRDSDKTPEEKQTAMIEAINEWAGIATSIISTKQSDFALTTDNLDKFLLTIPESEREFFKTRFTELENLKTELSTFKKTAELEKINSIMDRYAAMGLNKPLQERFRALRLALADGPSANSTVNFKLADNQTKQFALKDALENFMDTVIELHKSETLVIPPETAKPFKSDKPDHIETTDDTPPNTVNFKLDQAVKSEMQKLGIPIKGNSDKYSEIRQRLQKENPQLMTA